MLQETRSRNFVIFAILLLTRMLFLVTVVHWLLVVSELVRTFYLEHDLLVPCCLVLKMFMFETSETISEVQFSEDGFCYTVDKSSRWSEASA